MIQIDDKKNCCGCSACAQRCPKNCIVMKEDDEGFLYPEVNLDLCVNCGLCDKVCPIKEKSEINNYPKGYVAVNENDEIRLNSSSGGIFTPLAEMILREGGAVFGAAFDISCYIVKHICVDSTEGLEALRGSKYVQSRIEDTYIQVQKALTQDVKVLFSGTPCQIAGLKAYLGKEYELLYTVDILCHGVPSPSVWRKYLEKQESVHGSAVRRTFFRHKNYGWKMYALSLEFSNDKAYEQIFTKDPFMQMFLWNICLRPSCYACKFKNISHTADITLGDAWGVENYMPDMDDDKGTSLILVHSNKGSELLNIVLEKYNIRCKQVDVERMLPKTADSRKSVDEHRHRDRFIRKLRANKSFDQLFSTMQDNIFDRVKGKLKRIAGKG